MLDEIICHKLNILAKAADLSTGKNWCMHWRIRERTIEIALVGKYVDLTGVI